MGNLFVNQSQLLAYTIVLGLILALLGALFLRSQKFGAGEVNASFVQFVIITLVAVYNSFPRLEWWIAGAVIGLVLIIPALLGKQKAPLTLALAAVLVGEASVLIYHYLPPSKIF
jgi:hypothetical protein